MAQAMSGMSLGVLLALGWLGAVGSQDAGKPESAGRQPSNAQELLARLDQVAAGLIDYTVTGTTVAGGKTQQFEMAFKRPNLIRIDTHAGQVSVQPNGDIKGRLGRGPFGKIAQRLSRSDKRLLDTEGIPFYESDFVSMLARVEAKIKSGAVATMQADQTSYGLEVHSGTTSWHYRFAIRDLSPLESSRYVNGQRVEITRYADFRANMGLRSDHFRF